MKVCALATGIAADYCVKLLNGTPVTALADADVVIWTRDASPSVDAVRAAAPNATVVAITPFGLDGPWTDKPATEFTLQAWSGGMIGLGRGYPDRAPVAVGGQVGEWLSGLYAAVGALISQARGGGELVDVSMLEVCALCLTYYPVTYLDMVGRPFRTGRAPVTPGIEQASDGLVGLGVGTGQQWLDFCVMVGHPEWQEDRKLFANRGHLAPEIAAWMAERTVDEVLELASAFRIPHAPIGNGQTIPETDHFVARGSIIRDENGVVRPAPPLRVSHKPSRTRSELDGFEGLRIVDLTAFWAGPLCTHVMAMLGAEVIHIESTSRPDGTRMLAGMRGDDWWERSGIFAGLNTNKKSVTLDLQTERGRALLQQLIDSADVVVENYTPRVIDQLGLDLSRDDLVVIRMPGFGLDGPWRDNPAFAFVIEDAAGLSWLTGYPDRLPLSPYCVGDPNAGLHALVGLLQALDHRARTGEGTTVEAAMVDAALNIAADQLIEYSTTGNLPMRDGGTRTYLTAEDDTWVVIDTDGDFAEWCATRKADEIVDELWAQGVPVAKVMQPHDQGALDQLVARGFFEAVDHPIAGTARYPRLPFSIGGAQHRRHAPLLGEHNSEVLGALGLTIDDVTALESDGIIGRAPAS